MLFQIHSKMRNSIRFCVTKRTTYTDCFINCHHIQLSITMRTSSDSVLLMCNNKSFIILNSQVELTVYYAITLCAMHDVHKILRCCQQPLLSPLKTLLYIVSFFITNVKGYIKINIWPIFEIKLTPWQESSTFCYHGLVTIVTAILATKQIIIYQNCLF